MITESNGKLVYRYDAELLWIEAWGENSFRIRATKECKMPTENWALTEKPM
jgi:alpha-D-xyloside xylohydrolase